MIATVTIAPPPAALAAALKSRAAGCGGAKSGGGFLGRDAAAWRRETRGELGLPASGPVVMAGHQAAFWHPGVVMKSLVAQTIAERSGGAAAHVVVDQDVEPVAEVAVPVHGAEGELRRTTVTLLRQPTATVAAALPAFAPAPLPELGYALPQVAAGLRAIVSALRGRSGEPSAALQVTRAALDLLAPVLSAPSLVSPAALLRTSLATALLSRMATDPAACAAAYNRAVGAAPRAAADLAVLDDRIEVPLWRIADDGRRLRAWDDDLARFAAGEITLLPRALLMTGLLRLAACDLFVHGAGGIAYDEAMERWFEEWLGAAVAPAALATATALLPLRGTGAAAADLTSARRAYREVWFDPEAGAAPAAGLGRSPSAAKRALLDGIAALPRRSFERRAAWRHLHEHLDAARSSRAELLAERRAALAGAERARRERPILDDRTWAFPFHDPALLEDLRSAASA